MHILQHFAPKLCISTNFKMLFNAVAINCTISRFSNFLSIMQSVHSKQACENCFKTVTLHIITSTGFLIRKKFITSSAFTLLGVSVDRQTSLSTTSIVHAAGIMSCKKKLMKKLAYCIMVSYCISKN
jgi:hypothetical protein